MEHYIRTTHPQGANHTPMAGHPLFIEGEAQRVIGGLSYALCSSAVQLPDLVVGPADSNGYLQSGPMSQLATGGTASASTSPTGRGPSASNGQLCPSLLWQWKNRSMPIDWKLNQLSPY
jgi:hypothetical protein